MQGEKKITLYVIEIRNRRISMTYNNHSSIINSELLT